MSSDTINVRARVFGRDDIPQVNATIPIYLNESDIINFLIFSHGMQIPPNYLLLLAIKPENNDEDSIIIYKLCNKKNEISDYAFKNSIELILYPKEIKIDILYPNSTRKDLIIRCDLPISNIIEYLCNEIFHLVDPLSFAIYESPDNLMEPFPQNKTIIEINPYITNVYFCRRHWTKSISSFEDENDITFAFNQAVSIVYSKTFIHNYDINDLLAIYLTYRFRLASKALVFLKKGGKKQILSLLPKYLSNEYNKSKKKIISNIQKYEYKSPSELMKIFLNKCLENVFFGAILYPAMYKPNNNSKYIKSVVVITENYLYILNSNNYNELLSLSVKNIKKWKPIYPYNLKIFCIGIDKGLIEYEFISEYINFILNHLTSLMNLIKQQELSSDKQRNYSHSTKRKKIKKLTKSSFEFLISKGLFRKESMSPSEIVIEPQKVNLCKINVIHNTDIRSIFI